MKKRLTDLYGTLNTWVQLRSTTLPGNIKKDVFREFKRCTKLIKAGQMDELSCRIGNYTMKVSDPGLLQLLLREIMINEAYYVQLDSAEPYIIDCGSNVGFSILYFKIKFPNARIVGVEANPDTFGLLQENVKQFSNVSVRNNFAAATTGEKIDFYSSGAGDVASSHHAERGGASKKVVETIALKDLAADRVDLLKMDIEGGEFFIFNNKEDSTYMSRVKNVLLEYHHIFENGKPVNSLGEFLSVFEKNGFIYNVGAGKMHREFPYFQDLFFKMKRLG